MRWSTRRKFDALPRLFCLTDPDLLLNPDTPADFLAQLAALTERMAVGKAGLALDIADPAALRQESFRIDQARDWKIWEWEAQFWQDQAGTMPGGDPIYRASVDTTFALYNKRYFDPRTNVPSGCAWRAATPAGTVPGTLTPACLPTRRRSTNIRRANSAYLRPDPVDPGRKIRYEEETT